MTDEARGVRAVVSTWEPHMTTRTRRLRLTRSVRAVCALMLAVGGLTSIVISQGTILAGEVTNVTTRPIPTLRSARPRRPSAVRSRRLRSRRPVSS